MYVYHVDYQKAGMIVPKRELPKKRCKFRLIYTSSANNFNIQHLPTYLTMRLYENIHSLVYVVHIPGVRAILSVFHVFLLASAAP